MNADWRASSRDVLRTEAKEPTRLVRDGSSVFLERVNSRVLPFSPLALKRVLWRLATSVVVTPTMGELQVRLAAPCVAGLERAERT